MAASVSYRISGKYDGKAVTQAKGGMSQLTSSAKQLSGVIKGIGAGISVAALVSQFKECTKTFKENNTAQTQMFQALSSNTKVAQDSIRGLVQEFDKMSGVFSGSDMVKGGTLLASMGLDETQMKKTAKAAKDLASSGVMSLSQAFDTLGKSYSGNITSLKKMFPELAKLTKEELEAGRAVEILGNKFKGMEDAYANTFEGQITVLKDKIDGIKSAVGSISGFLMQENIGDITKLVDDVSNLADSALPRIAAWCSTIVHTFANFDLGALFDPKTIWEGWKNFFTTLANNFLTTINWLKAKLSEKVNDKMLNNDKAELEMVQATMAQLEATKNANLRKHGKAFLTNFDRQQYEATEAKIMDLLDSIAERELMKQMQSGDLGDFIKDIMGNYETLHQKNLGLLTGQDMEKFFQEQMKAFQAYANGHFVSSSGSVVTGGKTEDDDEDDPKPNGEIYSFGAGLEEEFLERMMEITKEITGLFGELGEVISLAIDGSGAGILLKMAGAFISELSQKAPAFGQLLNIVTEVAKMLVSPEVVKMVNAISGPIMNGITAMVRGINGVLAPIFEALTPVFWAIGKTLDFIGRVIETVAAVVYNIYVALYNSVNWFGQKSYKNVSDVWDGFNDWDTYNSPVSSAATSSASSVASYNAQRDIYVTINYNHSFVNGDAREIALQLRNEIASAERLGY